MDQGQQLFTVDLMPPWAVDDARFRVEQKRLGLHVNFPEAVSFPARSAARAARSMTCEGFALKDGPDE